MSYGSMTDDVQSQVRQQQLYGGVTLDAGGPGMVAERSVDRYGGWSTNRGLFGDLLSATSTRARTPRRHRPPGRHSYRADLHRSTSPRGARRAFSARTLPQVYLDEQLEVEQAERRIASIEATLRSHAQSAARDTAKMDMVVAAMDRLSNQVESMANGLVDNVLEPIQN